MVALVALESDKRDIAELLKAELDSDTLYNDFTDEQRGQLKSYFDACFAEDAPSAPEFLKSVERKYQDLIYVIVSYLRDRPADSLASTANIYYWSETSKGLAELIASAEYLIRSDSEPRRTAYCAENEQFSISFCLSFPRSGNTLFTNVADIIVPGSRYSVFWSDGRFYSRNATNFRCTTHAIVKDHHICNLFLRNNNIYIVRNFRNVLRSYVIYIYNEMRRNEDSRLGSTFASIKTFVDYCRSAAEFGPWENHISDAVKLAQTHRNLKILKYEDLVGPRAASVFADAFTFLGWRVSEADIDRAIAESNRIHHSLRETNADWKSQTDCSEAPPLVRLCGAATGDDWIEQLDSVDQRIIREIENCPASRALGYGE